MTCINCFSWIFVVVFICLSIFWHNMKFHGWIFTLKYVNNVYFQLCMTNLFILGLAINRADHCTWGSRVWHLDFRLGAQKGLFDKLRGQKQDFCIIIYTISAPRGPQQNLGAYAPVKVEPWEGSATGPGGWAECSQAGRWLSLYILVLGALLSYIPTNSYVWVQCSVPFRLIYF